MEALERLTGSVRLGILARERHKFLGGPVFGSSVFGGTFLQGRTRSSAYVLAKRTLSTPHGHLQEICCGHFRGIQQM